MNDADNRWPIVTRERPCPKCDHGDRCTLAADGRAGRCWRLDGGTTWHAPPDPNARPARTRQTSGPTTKRKASQVYATLAAAVTAARLAIRDATMFGEPWLYHDAAGAPLMAVARFDLPNGDKTCRPFHQVGAAGWAAGDPPLTRLPLYRLDALAAADPAARVYVCEGERCADALASVALLAVTSSHGASSAAKTDWSPLAGRADVVLLPDRDAAGERYAGDVLRLLARLPTPPARVSIVRLDHPRGEATPDGFDVADWIELRDGDEPQALAAALDAMADAATPEVPPAGDDRGHDKGDDDDAAAGLLADAPLSPAAAAEDAALAARPPLADAAALHGLAGRIVRAIGPHSEADPVALLLQLLAAYGNAIGRSAFFDAGGSRHHGNLFVALVGSTSAGRKGTSWAYVRTVMAAAAPAWAESRVTDGLASGEALIWQVRDPTTKLEPVKANGNVVSHREVPHDPGVDDKRLLIQAGELAHLLGVAGREGNTLSATVRNAWDTGTLKNLAKTSPATATHAHVSIVGHITAEELRHKLNATDQANGFGNRFLWAVVGRSKLLPEGGRFDTSEHHELIAELAAAVAHGADAGLIPRDPEARALWAEHYPRLTAGRAGIVGSMTARAAPQVARLAMLYALLDGDTWVRPPHLRAAIAVWAYCEASTAKLFGDRTGDRLADQLESALRRAGASGLRKTELSAHVGKHKPAAELDAALTLLIRLGRASERREPTPGRTAIRYRHAAATDLTHGGRGGEEAGEAEEAPADGNDDDLVSHLPLDPHGVGEDAEGVSGVR